MCRDIWLLTRGLGQLVYFVTKMLRRKTLSDDSRGISSQCIHLARNEADSRTLNLDILAHEHALLHSLLFSSEESRQIAFSLGLVPPNQANLFLRLSAFPNYAGHLIALRKDMKEWRPRRFRDLFIKGSHTHSVSIIYAGIAIILILVLFFLLAVTGTIGVWIILRHVT